MVRVRSKCVSRVALSCGISVKLLPGVHDAGVRSTRSTTDPVSTVFVSLYCTVQDRSSVRGISTGELTFVDLASYSAPDRSTAVSKPRQREITSANKSLQALDAVVSALAASSQSVPYESSKLTQVCENRVIVRVRV